MRLLRENCAAIAIDIQEKLLPVINGGDAVAADSAKLIRGLRVLEVPVLACRQYPQGLGNTVEPIREALGPHTPYDKSSFSVCGNEALLGAIKALGKRNILLFGIEAHICVLQSVIDLKALGFQPVLVCDCVGSRYQYDTKIAIGRAADEGAILTTAEAILFELLQKAGGSEFKAISSIVK